MRLAPLAPIVAIDAIVETDRLLIPLLEGLSLDEWDTPTIVPGWRVRHVAGHLLDTALRRLTIVRDGFSTERPASAASEDIRAFVDQANAHGVAVYGRLSPRVVAAQMHVATVALHEHLRAIDPHARAAFAVSWAGEAESANWFDIARELTERWHHQQQIRLAVHRPGIMMPALYHPVLDCFMRVLPHAYRDVAAPDGARIVVEVTGACGGAWHLVRHDGRWRLTADPGGNVTASIRIPEDLAWRIFTKGASRAEAEREVALVGDRGLALRVLDAVAIVG